MTTYQDIPTVRAWEADLQQALGRPLDAPGVVGPLSRDHVLHAIHDLLAQYDSIRDADPERAAFRRHLIAVYLYEATSYWLQKGNRIPKLSIPGTAPGPRFVAGLGPHEGAPVEALRDVSRSAVRAIYEYIDRDEQERIREAVMTGVGLENTQADEDEIKRGDPQVVWLTTAAARLRYKLRFRNGLAYRMEQPHLGLDLTISLFSTTRDESEHGDGLTHFVMDAHGHIYCGYDKNKGRAFKFFHSSLVDGKPTLAAGMMRVERGQVRSIVNASGHYKPEGRHMAILLQRLRLYGVDLAQVQLHKHDAPQQVYDARQVLDWNGFPE